MGEERFVWRRNWGTSTTLLRIPWSLQVVSRDIDGCEAVKLVMKDYELGYEEYYLDDLEDSVGENEPPEEPQDDDDQDDSDIESESDDEVDIDLRTALNNDLMEELEALTRQLQTLRGLLTYESRVSGIMTIKVMINQAEERVIYIRTHLSNHS